MPTLTPDQFADFASSTIAGGAGGAGTALATGDTTLLLAAGTGAHYPATAPYYLTLGALTATPEVVKVTARSGDTLTLVRAQDGTLAQTWSVGASVDLSWTTSNATNLWSALSSLNSALTHAQTFNVKDYGAVGDGVTNDTAAILAAWNALKTAGTGTLSFPTGHYLTADLILQGASMFALRGEAGAVLYNSPNTVASPGQATHDVLIIADCTDFAVEGVGVDGRRDIIAADQYLTAVAASGQNQIAIQDGTQYVVGQGVWLMGGLTANGGTEKNQNQLNLLITAINGNILTLSANLTNTYTGTGASGGAYLSQYQTGGFVAYSAAGRTLSNEDAQNGIHLLSCQRFLIRDCTAQNVWESPIKCGTGFQATTPTDGCAYGRIIGNHAQHGYDQGISVWNSEYVTVVGNECRDAGWAGISFSHCNDCVATGNVCTANLYSPPMDLNEGTGIAVEGGVHVSVVGNICTGNNSNAIRLNISPLYGGIATAQGVVGALTAGATSLTLSSANPNFVAGATFTIVDPANAQMRETIYVASASGTAVTLARALRNSYNSGPTIYARYGDDVLIANNVCALSALGAGIHTQQQSHLRVVGNVAAENGFLNGAFVDTIGCHGIHLYTNCQSAVVEGNTCTENVKEGIFVDNLNDGAIIQGNICNENGLKGVNSEHGINIYGGVDLLVSGNTCNTNTNNGIYFQAGTAATTNCTVADNTCMHNNAAGIWLDNGGSAFTVRGNRIAYNNDTGIKVYGYANSLFAANTCYNQNGQEGIRFDDSGTSYCTDNRVFDNLLYSDNSSQSWGFRELNHSARSILRGNRVYGNWQGQLSLSASSRLAPDVVLDSNTNDSTVLGAANVAMPTGDMQNASVNLWVDETGNALHFQVKYSSGAVKNGTVTLA